MSLFGIDLISSGADHSHGVANGHSHAEMYKSIVQGDWAFSLASSQAYQYVFINTSNAQNDEIEYDIFSEAGTKTLEFLVSTYTNRAIATVYVDNILQGTIDLYDSPGANNVFKTLTIAVVGTGNHSVKLKAATRHVSSTGWYLTITTVRIK